MSSEIQPAPLHEQPLSHVRNSARSTSKTSHGQHGAEESNALFPAAALVPALLASSCCIPQLVLNVFSFGCAGFAALTPFRPVFLALTAVGIAAAFQRRGLTSRTLMLGLLATSLAFSDVAVSKFNEGALQRSELFGRPLPGWLQTVLTPPQWVPPSQLETKAATGHPLSPPPAAVAAPPAEATVVMTALHIKCSACGMRIKSGLQAKFGNHVKSVEIQEKSNAVVVHLRDQAAVNDRALLAAMDELQSPATLVRRDIHALS